MARFSPSWSFSPVSQPAAPALHVPVMLLPMLERLAIRPSGRYLDLTYGRGGYARAILERLDEGELYVCDRDPEAQASAGALAATDPRVRLIPANFADLDERAELAALKFDGVVADLGVSSPQLDEAERGFSFMRDGPLDMRMDPSSGESAAQWLAAAAPGEMMQVLRRLGEESQARRIALAIVRARAAAPISRTLQLARIVEEAVGGRRGRRIHPATKTFQAIRMHVNAELPALEALLKGVEARMAPGGRFVVVSFHSLEDRMVKRFLQAGARPESPHPALPPPQPTWSAIGRDLCSEAEAAQNPRARSAVLRWGQRWDRVA